MLIKDKIFLVLYVDVSRIPIEDTYEYLSTVTDAFERIKDESVQMAILPVREQETRLECINPVLLNEEQYAQVQEKLNDFQKVFDELMEQVKEKNNG